MFRRVTVGLMLVSLVALATGCGGDSGGKAAATITIDNYAFTPTDVTVKVNDSIRVINKDDVEHTVTARDKSFDTGPLGAGQTTTFTVHRTGSFAFVCTIHSYMTGTITITP